MSAKNDVTCSNCGAPNPHDYTFCFHCRHEPKSANKSAKKAAKTAAKKPAKKRAKK